jgi:protein-S-isoprenylcysteine O-methyltransferase Ste14
MKEKNGEHPYGDLGQVILFGLFLLVWVGDSFFLHLTTFPAGYLPWYIRLAFSAVSWMTAIYLIKSGHQVISHEQPPIGLVTTGAFKLVRHPLYLGCNLVYLGMAISTACLSALVLWVIICILYNYLSNY